MQTTNFFYKKRGVTGRLADHPSGAPDLLLWVDTIYKLFLAQLKFNAIEAAGNSEKMYFNEKDLQNTAIHLTKDLLGKNNRGEFIYLKDFFNRYASIPLERKYFLKGIVDLRHIIQEFLGG